VRVLDFTRILSGPYCSLLLADLGADVIKVERADRGDDTRAWGPPFIDSEQAISTYFASLNRSKRSIAVDFRSEEDRGLISRLIGGVDVVLENFRPGTAASIGLDYATLHALNPRLVLASISGWGQEGEYSELPGTEIVVEAMSGLMSVTGGAGAEPVRMGIAMVDIATGLTVATRVVAALLQARASGEGSYVDCSLYAVAVGVLGTLITSYSATGVEPGRLGSHHPTICPYGGFPASDGYLITGVINDPQWPVFCEAMELPELRGDAALETNAGRVVNRVRVEAAIAGRSAERPVAYWLERLRARELLAAPVRTVGQAVQDPATQALGLLVEFAGHPGLVSPRLDGVPHDGSEQRVPALGEDTAAVIEELLGGRLDVERPA
jgi:crotonobetainyl-CoA:carnitine CoA-transferase CaiB-like acyl-CoA transferase